MAFFPKTHNPSTVKRKHQKNQNINVGRLLRQRPRTGKGHECYKLVTSK